MNNNDPDRSPITPDEGIDPRDAGRLKEANTCIGLGVAVGALGVGGALLSAAACPLCVVITPALIGAGVIQRRRIGKEQLARRAKQTEGK